MSASDGAKLERLRLVRTAYESAAREYDGLAQTRVLTPSTLVIVRCLGCPAGRRERLATVYRGAGGPCVLAVMANRLARMQPGKIAPWEGFSSVLLGGAEHAPARVELLDAAPLDDRDLHPPIRLKCPRCGTRTVSHDHLRSAVARAAGQHGPVEHLA